MQQGFPPEPPWLGIIALGVNVALLLLAIAGIAWQSQRKTSGWAPILWGAAPFAVVWFGSWLLERNHGRALPAVPWALPLTTVICYEIAFLQSLVRLRPESRMKPGVWLVVVILVFAQVDQFLIGKCGGPRWAIQLRTCRNQLKELGIAFYNYQDKKERFPPSTAGSPAVSWRTELLPMLGVQLPATYDPTQDWSSQLNAQVARERVDAYLCPAVDRSRDGQGRYFTAYVAPTGGSTALRPGRSRTSNEFPDGSSHTILLVEACGLEIVWTQPRDFDIETQPVGVNLKGQGLTDSPGLLSSYHPGRSNVLMVDGSVRALSQQTDPALLRKLLTADGGEDVGHDW